jgi:hypothetical protein
VPVVGSDVCGKRSYMWLKFRHVLIESRGECSYFLEDGIYLLKCSFLLSYDSRSANHYI